MKRLCLALVLCCAGVLAWAKDGACAQNPCPSKRDLKQAQKLYDEALELARTGQEQEALDKLTRATELVPQDADYQQAKAMTQQQVIAEHVERGNAFMANALPGLAINEFATALQMDPTNDYAAQRLRDASADKPAEISPGLKLAEESQPVKLLPSVERHDFDYKGDSRGLLEWVARTYDVKAQFDEAVTSRPVQMTVQDVDFASAMSIASKLTRTFWVPIGSDQVLFANDSPEMRQALEPMGLHTFYISNASTPQELNDLLGMLRNVFQLKYVSMSPGQDVITVRAPMSTMDAVARFLREVSGGKPQVMIDVDVYEVDHSVTRNFGLSVPTQYTLFNIPSEARQLLNQGGTQDLINQLIASGLINQGNISGVEALIAQFLAGQNSIFNQPFGTFGGGITLEGLVIPATSAIAQLNESNFRSIQKVSLRAGDGQAATLHIGSRYPILNASFAPILNSSALSKVLGNGSYIPAFPSFTYEDLGLTLKATPAIHGDIAVTLDTDMEMKQLTGQSINGVPVLVNREYKGMIRVPDGATAVMVGTISQSEQHGLTGPPFLSLIPGAGRLFAPTNTSTEEDELLITLTPHIVRSSERHESQPIVLPSGQ